MNEQKFQAELSYQTAIFIVKDLLKKGLLTDDEYTIIDTKLQAEFCPSLGALLCENRLINKGF